MMLTRVEALTTRNSLQPFSEDHNQLLPSKEEEVAVAPLLPEEEPLVDPTQSPSP